ncbi:MAG: ArnT family glycosyltransferase [Ktedonobacterales bacterium]
MRFEVGSEGDGWVAVATGVKVQHDQRRVATLEERYRRIFLGGLAVALLALAVFLHLYRLSSIPGWDPEEGYNLDIAWNLAHGRLRLFSLASAFGQHPPLFYLQLVVSIHLFGYNITALRTLAAFYAILTDAAVLLVGRRLIGTPAALWAMAVYSVAPVMLANSRWGYSYCMLALIGLLCLGALWRYQHSDNQLRWLVTAAALAGLATLSDYEGIAWVALVLLVAVWKPPRRWREIGIALAIGLGIPLLGLASCLLLDPRLVLADLATTLGRSAGGNPLTQLLLLLLNYLQFLSADAWLLFGVVGLFLAPARTRGLLLGAVAVLGLVLLKVRAIGLSLHTAVPLLPLLALGAGILLDLGLRYLYRWLEEWLPSVVGRRRQSLSRMLATVIVFVVVVSPVTMVTLTDLAQLEANSFTTRQDAILGTPADAAAVSRYIFTHAHNGDLVLASPTLAWIFDSPDHAPETKGADILQTLAQSGESAAFYSAGLPSWRWTYTVSLASARYVVVDNLLRELAQPDELPALVQVLDRVQSWRLVFSRGQYAVYEQPPSPALAVAGP